VGAGGTVYYVDTFFHAIGTVGGETIVGGNDEGVGRDGPAASAHIAAEGAMAFSGGVLYFADTANQRIRARDVASNVVYTVAGNGRAGRGGGGGSEAAYEAPQAVGGRRRGRWCWRIRGMGRFGGSGDSKKQRPAPVAFLDEHLFPPSLRYLNLQPDLPQLLRQRLLLVLLSMDEIHGPSARRARSR